MSGEEEITGERYLIEDAYDIYIGFYNASDRIWSDMRNAHKYTSDHYEQCDRFDDIRSLKWFSDAVYDDKDEICKCAIDENAIYIVRSRITQHDIRDRITRMHGCISSYIKI